MASDIKEPLTGPGIIQTFVTLSPESKISQQALEVWFDKEYAQALIETGIIKSIWRFKAGDPEYEKQNMLIYEVDDLAAVKSGELQKIPRTSSLFPTNDEVDNFIEQDSRVLSLVELYETKKQPENATTTIIYAAMEPGDGGAADLDAWYREEHNHQMSKEPGWLRTKRYGLLLQHKNNEKSSGAPSFLAIHDFGEGHKIGTNVEPLDPVTDWTQKCMSQAKAIDAAIYHKVKTFGKAAAS